MTKIFDFLERCKKFAKDVFGLLEKVPKKGQNVRSLGKRDRLMKLRTSRREASESKYFVDLLSCSGDLTDERQRLSQEAQELTNILSSMIVKSEGNSKEKKAK